MDGQNSNKLGFVMCRMYTLHSHKHIAGPTEPRLAAPCARSGARAARRRHGYVVCEKQGLYGRPDALFRRFPGHWPNFGAEALAVAEAPPRTLIFFCLTYF